MKKTKKNIKYLYELKKELLKKAIEKLLSKDKDEYYYYESDENNFINDILNKKLENHYNIAEMIERQILKYLEQFDNKTISFVGWDWKNEYFIIVSYNIQRYLKETECY